MNFKKHKIYAIIYFEEDFMKDVITTNKKLINDAHLKNIFSNESYLELGIIDVNVIKRLLNFELINIDEITFFPVQNKGLGHSNLLDQNLRNYMPFHFFKRLAENNPKLQLFITYGLLQYRSTDNHERFMPIILIPVSIYYENDDILVQMISSPFENPMIYTVISNSKIFFLQTYAYKDIYSLDFILTTINEMPGVSVRLDNYLTYGQVKDKDIILSYKNSSKKSNANDHRKKNFDHVYLSNYFNDYSSCVLNKTQREVLNCLINGDSLNITGFNGTGKTTVLKDFIVNNIAKNKKTLYISNSKESIKDIKNFLNQLMLESYFIDLTESFKSISNPPISESYYDPTDEIEPLTNQLKGYYDVISHYEEEMNKSLYDFRFNEMLYYNYIINHDIANKISIEAVNLDNISSIYKYEYDEIKKVLDSIERSFKKIDSFKESVWNQIPIINNITHDNQVFNVVFQLNTGLKKLREYEIALGTFGVKSVSSFSEMNKYINPLSELEETEIPSEWKTNLQTFKKAKNEYERLKEDIFKYQEAEYHLSTKYKNIHSINIESEIQLLFGDFYDKENSDILEKILKNRSDIKRIIRANAVDIVDFTNYYLEISKLINWEFLEKDEYFNEIIYLFDLFSNYNICGKTMTIVLHNRNNDINELDNLYNNIILLNEELEQLEKKTPKLKSLDFSKGNIEYENESYRMYDTKKKKAKKFIREYNELAGFSYVSHHKNIQSINALKEYYSLIKNKKYRKIISDFIQSLNEEDYIEIKVLLKTFVKAYNNILNHIDYFKDYEIDFYKDNIRNRIDLFEKYLAYINNLYESNDRLFSVILDNDLGYVKPIEYFNLKNEIDKLRELIAYLKKNKEYYQLFGFLYQAEETNVLNILKIINMYDGYISVFISEEDIYNSFKKYDELRKVVEVIVELIKEIGENLRLYSMIFKDSVSRYYFSNIEKNIEYLSKLLEAKEELSVYLNITHGIGILNKYHLDSIISFIENNDDIEGISAKFSEVYFGKIINEYITKHNGLITTSELINTLNKTIILEDVICKQKGIRFINEIFKKSPVEIKKHKSKHFDYPNFFRTHHNRLRVFLSNRSFVNTYYKYIDYETIIIDDAHMLTTGEYNNLFKNKQVVVCGDYQSNKIVNQNLLSLANSIPTYTFKKRYFNAPRKITSRLQPLYSPHIHNYSANNGVKVIEKGLEDYLYNIYIQDCNVKINYFIKNINHQRNAFEAICRSFYNKGIPFDEIIKILNENIRICDINARNYMTSDYNILFLKDYCFENSQIVSSNLLEILLLAKNELIIYDGENNLLKNIDLKFFKSIKELVVSEKLFNNNSICNLNANIENRLLELGYKVFNVGNGIDMLIQKPNSEELITLLILFNNGNVTEVLNEYRDFYNQYIKNGHKVIIRTVFDLLDGEEDFIDGIVGELNG